MSPVFWLREEEACDHSDLKNDSSNPLVHVVLRGCDKREKYSFFTNAVI